MKDASKDILTSNEKIIERCAEFYKMSYSSTTKIVEIQYQHSMAVRINIASNEEVSPILESGIREVLSQLKKDKAPWSDYIKIDILKAGDEESIRIMHKLFNAILQMEETPKLWKNAIFISIHKKGDKAESVSYKPISFSTIFKLYRLWLAACTNIQTMHYLYSINCVFILNLFFGSILQSF